MKDEGSIVHFGWFYMDVSTTLHHLVGLSSKLFKTPNLHITMNY